MGNKLCKKKSDVGADYPKSPTPFDRIINRLHLRPNSWKSDSNLNQKQVNSNPNDQICPHLLSKSSDWTDVALEVPDKDDAVHLRNPKLSLIFSNDGTPTPPPRKHKKGLRERIEAVAKNSLQAFQAKKAVEEPLCVKKQIKQTCPLDDHDCAIHNRNHKHKKEQNDTKQVKRRKNLSIVSLPNYNEFKLTVANFDDIDKQPTSTNNSLMSLPTDSNCKKLSTGSTGKLETCMTRCRSFGSLLPQQLLDKLKVRKVPIDVESDDSFGGLEDWDLRIIEHYNPKDASLPRPNKLARNNKEVLSGIESLIVKDDEADKPKVPPRRSESLLKKINREASESAVEQRTEKDLSATPPPSPERKPQDIVQQISAEKLAVEENGVVEHSSLMKILEEFSIKDKQEQNERKLIIPNAELQKKIDSVDEFLYNEKLSTNTDLHHAKLSNMVRSA